MSRLTADEAVELMFTDDPHELESGGELDIEEDPDCLLLQSDQSENDEELPPDPGPHNSDEGLNGVDPDPGQRGSRNNTDRPQTHIVKYSNKGKDQCRAGKQQWLLVPQPGICSTRYTYACSLLKPTQWQVLT